MLGLSLGKLIFTITLIVAVWRLWKYLAPVLARFQQLGAAERQREAARQAGGRKAAGRSQWTASPRPAGPTAVDLIECPRCGTFIPAGSYCPSPESCTFRRG
jgi:hypothetical protein